VLESTVAHEVAHQWFYNVVGNDQVDEPWLDEALVQYITGLYYVDTQGQTAARSYRASWLRSWERVNRAEIPIGLPSSAYSREAYSPIVYGRGPLFITELAEAMGQETFNTFLRAYYQAYRWDIGTGEAFERLAKAHCSTYTKSDCDLMPLFKTWVYEK
jgi:aminopeptidase N